MQSLAVVPIFVSAGAAVLPTVVAAGASVLAIVFKPRELWRVCRGHPVGTVGVLCAIALGVWGASWMLQTPAGAAVRGDGAWRVDWTKVALELLAQHEAGKAFTTVDAAGEPVAGTQVAATLPSASTQAAGAMWTMDFSRRHDDGSGAPEKLKQLWAYKPDDTMFLAQPLVAGGRVYVAGCQADHLAGYTGILACLDEQTGKPEWETSNAGQDFLRPFFSSPALSADGKYLVIGQGLHEDADCSLLCFETASGKLHWAVKTPLHIESSPAIFGDIAVVGAGAIEGSDGRARGNPGYVLAVRISDGKTLWQQPVNDPESSPAVDEDGTVYIGSGFNGNAIVAILSAPDDQLASAAHERVLWRRALDLPMTGDITIAGDLIVAGGGNGDFVHSAPDARGVVVALDRKTGALRWRMEIGDSVLGSIAYRNGVLLCPSRTGEIVALAAQSGRPLWRARISGKSPVLAGVAFAKQRIYAVSSDGYLGVLAPGDGAILEKIALNDPANPGTGLSACAPQIAGSRVIVGTETGGVVCLFGAEAGHD